MWKHTYLQQSGTGLAMKSAVMTQVVSWQVAGKSCHYKLRASPAKATMELPFARNYPVSTSELPLSPRRLAAVSKLPYYFLPIHHPVYLRPVYLRPLYYVYHCPVYCRYRCRLPLRRPRPQLPPGFPLPHSHFAVLCCLPVGQILGGAVNGTRATRHHAPNTETARAGFWRKRHDMIAVSDEGYGPPGAMTLAPKCSHCTKDEK